MAAKSVSISVRVSDDDAAFLAGLQVDDAKTPSEKLRALLSAEQRRQEGAQDPTEAVEMFSEMLRPAHRQTRRLSETFNSEAVQKIFERLPELAGVAYSGPKHGSGETTENALTRFEGRLLDQAFSLLEELLTLGLVSHAKCYDPDAISKRLGRILELVELIKLSRRERGENQEEVI